MERKIGIVLLAVFSIVYAGKVFGPEDWGFAAPLCTGQFQSPVDIITRSAQTNSSYSGLVLTFDDDTDGVITGSLSNNGHAPTVTIDKTKGGVTLVGGPLGQSTFSLEQFHFHFGCENNLGSEHTVDGNSFPSEMHLVFYNTFYGRFQEAASKSDGLAVIGVFLQMNGEFNDWMENIAVIKEC